MIAMKTSFIFLPTLLLTLSACDSAEEIPQKTDQEELEEVIGKNAEEIEQKAISIKEAAAEAVKIIEEDAQSEIDAIEPETIEAPEDDQSILESE